MKKIGAIEICGISYTLWLATPKEVPELEDAYAICDRDTSRILFNRSDAVNAQRFSITFLHEILHAVFEASGALATLTEVVKDGTDIDFLEEHLVRMLTPGLMGALKQAKGLLP